MCNDNIYDSEMHVHVPDYSLFCKDRDIESRAGGGVLLYIHDYIVKPTHSLNDLNTEGSVWCLISPNNCDN